MFFVCYLIFISFVFFFFFNDTATTEIYTLSLHDALPISCAPLPGGEPGHDLDGAVPVTRRATHAYDGAPGAGSARPARTARTVSATVRIAARYSSDPRLTRATPSSASRGSACRPGMNTTFSGAPQFSASAAIDSSSPTPGTNTPSAPAFVYASARLSAAAIRSSSVPRSDPSHQLGHRGRVVAVPALQVDAHQRRQPGQRLRECERLVPRRRRAVRLPR